ncbi:MAG: hypothetical protein UY99_C0005G0036 [Parcubacteria group bacterium GW2011_GWA1_59_11]|nr:MAG: hypothetical protein UY99_C0005G0036 [Parcubacteria group bacterium GW2011_GWA1_59_11]
MKKAIVITLFVAVMAGFFAYGAYTVIAPLLAKANSALSVAPR